MNPQCKRSFLVYKKIALILLVYAVIVFAGGFAGFVLKKSMPSLLAGGFSGLIFLFASVSLLVSRKKPFYLACVLLLVLAAFFAYRFLKSNAFFPSGMMLILTSFTLFLIAFQIKQLNQEKLNDPSQ